MAEDGSGYFITQSKDGQYFFVLKARNGQVLATSRPHTTKQSAEDGIRAVRGNRHRGESFRHDGVNEAQCERVVSTVRRHRVVSP